jgi:hypothetical protein
MTTIISLNRFSLTPGFSPMVVEKMNGETVSTVSLVTRKAVETAHCLAALNTGLKPGVNESRSASFFCQ